MLASRFDSVRVVLRFDLYQGNISPFQGLAATASLFPGAMPLAGIWLPLRGVTPGVARSVTPTGSDNSAAGNAWGKEATDDPTAPTGRDRERRQGASTGSEGASTGSGYFLAVPSGRCLIAWLPCRGHRVLRHRIQNGPWVEAPTCAVWRSLEFWEIFPNN
jgi:hypothetical protein